METLLLEKADIQYAQLSKDKLEEAVRIGRRTLFVDETICKALDLGNDSKAADELEELFVKAAIDGLSVIAIDKVHNNVVGICFNKLHVKGRPDDEYYENLSRNCKYAASKMFLTFMKETDYAVDLFEYCQSDCYLEIMFLGVLPDYRGKSIAYNLCKATEKLTQNLLSGRSMKISIDNTNLALEPVPKYISAIFTSSTSQKLGPKLGMKVAGSASLNSWTYKEKTIAEILENPAAELQYHYKMLSVSDNKL